MFYLIAYDVTDAQRLRRTARLLERHAIRCQKSVFLFRGDACALRRIIADAARILDPERDCLQAWRLAQNQSTSGTGVGPARNASAVSAVCTAESTFFLEERT